VCRIQNGQKAGVGGSHWAENDFFPTATKKGGFLSEKAALKRNSVYNKKCYQRK
jgi:hypothetical protein